ncbi:hypothetical protein UG55_1006123 [Frankia sp. EI5c]|nr:hypothetical protein UG55_1006123 [Frankia sp. EI5c]
MTIAASMFAPAVRSALREPGSAGVVTTLHRICNVYAAIGLAVPVLGIATAMSMNVLGDPWLVVSVVLTGVAAVVLAVAVLPGQQRLLEQLTSPAGLGTGQEPAIRGLAISTGLFSLLWTVVTVLMIARPGSTTGA